MVDLHTHSTASDGALAPSALCSLAAEKGLSVLALTDHDTVDGLDEARRAASDASLTLVSGVELNIEWPTGEFHLLGLGFTSISSGLASILADLRKGRDERNVQIVEKMREEGFDVSLDELIASAGTSVIGRPHLAGYLVEKKIVKTRQQAFDRYLGKGRPFFVPRYAAPLDEAVAAVNASGGVPVIAHPLSLYVSWGKIEPVLREIFDRGVKALEAWHPAAREADCRRLEYLGKNIGFAITAGSDFHGEVKPDRRLGKTAGNISIDDRFWTEELLPLLERRAPLS